MVDVPVASTAVLMRPVMSLSLRSKVTRSSRKSTASRKYDLGDARTVAVVAIRTKGLRQVVLDDERLALWLLSERRRELVPSRTQTHRPAPRPARTPGGELSTTSLHPKIRQAGWCSTLIHSRGAEWVSLDHR